ncbi:MAG: RNA polymerase sigma factor [bacterium]
MSDFDDVKLVRECLNGNTKAFETIIDRYQKPVFNTALRMVNVLEDAQDITQSVFVKAFEKLDMYNPKYKFFSWIYRMTVNDSINFIKQKKYNEEIDSQVVALEKTPEERFEESDLREKIGKALMSLQIDYRAVIILRHFEQFSYREISYILDTPEKIVKSRLYTARQKLKEVLLKKGIQNHA